MGCYNTQPDKDLSELVVSKAREIGAPVNTEGEIELPKPHRIIYEAHVACMIYLSVSYLLI